jgi:hypothetical protein
MPLAKYSALQNTAKVSRTAGAGVNLRPGLTVALVAKNVPHSGEVVNVVQGERRSNAALRGAVATVACVVCAIAALCLAFTTWNQAALAGFPDGHVTDYEKVAGAPLTILAWAQAGFGLLFLALAFPPIRVRGVGLLVGVVAFVLIATAARVGVPWYFGTHLGLDNGIGG